MTSPPSQAVFEQAFALHRSGALPQAITKYDDAIRLAPGVADIHQFRAIALAALGRFDEALAGYDRAVELDSGSPATYYNRANLLRDMQLPDRALADFEIAIRLKSDFVEAHNNIALLLDALGHRDEALERVDRAIATIPRDPALHGNRATILQKLGRPSEALDSVDRALALDPGSATAHYNRGTMLVDLRRLADAIASFEISVGLDGGNAGVFNNLANALRDIGRLNDAVACYDRALGLDPSSPATHRNRALALTDLARFDEAAKGYRRVLELDPDCPEAIGQKLFVDMQRCDWRNYDSQLAQLDAPAGNVTADPFIAAVLIDDPASALLIARRYVAFRKLDTRVALPATMANDRLRIGYFSADFHDHATMHLLAETFEHHDRARFDITAFSYGPNLQDHWRQRLERAVDRLVDIRALTDADAALRARALGIDIAVDLKGWTRDARLGIFAARAAPIQVTYLGFPGTTGAPFIDYLIADDSIIPEPHRHVYSEKIAYLPHCYQANCQTRDVSKMALDRASQGLPATGFVYCCFNQTYKITPAVFRQWMHILAQVEGSILWLWSDIDTARYNLRTAAEAAGIAPDRLVFAERVTIEDHLNRLRLADLFLDTFPCNAHTTASDALRMGVPVLSRPGRGFASRVAASLLTTIDLPELIAPTADAYELAAIELGNRPDLLTELRNKLTRNLATSPLFDSQRFTRDLEAAYIAMDQRARLRLPPDHLRI